MTTLPHARGNRSNTEQTRDAARAGASDDASRRGAVTTDGCEAARPRRCARRRFVRPEALRTRSAPSWQGARDLRGAHRRLPAADSGCGRDTRSTRTSRQGSDSAPTGSIEVTRPNARALEAADLLCGLRSNDRSQGVLHRFASRTHARNLLDLRDEPLVDHDVGPLHTPNLLAGYTACQRSSEHALRRAGRTPCAASLLQHGREADEADQQQEEVEPEEDLDAARDP